MTHRPLNLILFLLSVLSAFAGTGASTPTPTEQRLADLGMVRVLDMDPTIRVEMMYARPDNFVGEVLYTDLHEAYLHPDAAKALVRASELLRKERPDLRLLVKDAARPMSVQAKMHRVVANTPKAKYVSNPKNGGGLHNYGLAVDITLCDVNGKELPMGTKVDHLGREANIDKEDLLVRTGVMTQAELDNRLLLRRVMRQAGFTPLRSEWWHFNLVSRAEAKKRYKVIP